MQELILQEKTLKFRRRRNQIILAFHSFVLLPIGVNLITIFYDRSKVMTLTGCFILLQVLIFVVFFSYHFISLNTDIEKELAQLSKTSVHIKAVNKVLDECRDKMLFDNDDSYWRILEQLEEPNDTLVV